MEVRLSKEQFEVLLKAVYLGDWMVNANRVPGEYLQEFVELEQQLLLLAQKAGFTRIVEFDPTLSRFFHTSEFDEALQPFIEEYDDIAFWNGLVDRMAARDFEETYGDAAARMPPDERFNKYGVYVDKYESEIETHGIDRLRIAGA